jgi:HD-GYP domain-containing protein (c-di-GMP phosphodiesterase class II)
MPLRIAGADETGRAWECVRCGAVYFAVMAEDSVFGVRMNVRPLDSAGLSAEKGPQAHDFSALVRAASAPRLWEAPPVKPAVVCQAESRFTRGLDASIEAGWGAELPSHGPAFLRQIVRHGAAPVSSRLALQFTAQTNRSADQLSSFFDCLQLGKDSDLGVVEQVCREALMQAIADLDQLVLSGINAAADSYPNRHSLSSAILAMAMGINLGYDQRTLASLGIGCVLHDLGMLGIDPAVFWHDRVVSLEEHLAIARHPVAVFDLLQPHWNRVPAAARMVAYQIHERCDGSGYPRGRAGSQITELSQVAAVADAFVAMVSPRLHRPSMVPYCAMETMLKLSQRGLFGQRFVRALLETVSLFPLGSFVALSDDRVGRVVRSNGPAYDRPVIELTGASPQQDELPIVDLSQTTGLKVVRALAGPPELLASR